MIILLPPSEGKSSEVGHSMFKTLDPTMLADVNPIVEHLQSLKGPSIGKFYSLKDSEKATIVHAKNQASIDSGCIPALERYTGVVYTHLDYASLRAKKRAGNRIHIISGFFGLISGAQEIPDYKMPMNTWLRNYWREKNTARLALAAKKKPVISLLPQVYAKAVDLQDAHHIEFKVSGGKKLAGHHGKAIKGKFVRFLIENDIQSFADVEGFNEDGFSFDGEHFIQP